MVPLLPALRRAITCARAAWAIFATACITDRPRACWLAMLDASVNSVRSDPIADVDRLGADRLSMLGDAAVAGHGANPTHVLVVIRAYGVISEPGRQAKTFVQAALAYSCCHFRVRCNVAGDNAAIRP